MSDVTLEVGTCHEFCVSASLSFTDPGDDFGAAFTPTQWALTLNALASAAGRQSIKADLGANRAPRYACYGAFDFTGETPAAPFRVDVYWAPSTSGTQGTGNVFANSGADAACPDGAVGSVTLAEFLRACHQIGSFITTDDAAVQSGFVGVFVPPSRYGQIVVVNNSGDALEASDANMAVWLVGIVDDVA